MTQKQIFILGAAAIFFATASQAMAHFGMVIPSTNIVRPEKKSVDVTLSFSHPFEIIGMDLAKPAAFYVVVDDKRQDLASSLKKTEVMDHQAWQTTYKVRRPGVYQFVMEPTPYWESAEDLSIIHYTKTIIAAYGADTGWDKPVGLPTEIVPLLRPFGNYAGNSFSGQVLINGKPVPHAEVEVEYYNEDGKLQAPSDYHITQVIKADSRGTFNFTCPLSGWWGFSALGEAEYTLPDPDGKDKPVEIGAVLWIYMDAYKQK
jgi:cobalt/nickel transport protein